LDTTRRDKIWLAYGSLGRRSWRTVAVFVAFSWQGLLVSCILHVCVWISKVFFICCLGLRQHCCSFFPVTAPGLALSPYFPANVPRILFLDIRFFFFWWILHSSYMAGSPPGYGSRKAGYSLGSYLRLGHIFMVACLLGLVLAIYTVGFDSRIALGRYSGRYRSDI
jgi:hypothetical protein